MIQVNESETTCCRILNREGVTHLSSMSMVLADGTIGAPTRSSSGGFELCGSSISTPGRGGEPQQRLLRSFALPSFSAAGPRALSFSFVGERAESRCERQTKRGQGAKNARQRCAPQLANTPNTSGREIFSTRFSLEIFSTRFSLLSLRGLLQESSRTQAEGDGLQDPACHRGGSVQPDVKFVTRDNLSVSSLSNVR